MSVFLMMSNILPWLAALAAIAGILGTTAGFLGRMSWVLDLFSHFRPQYLVLLLVTAIVLVWYGHYPLAGASALFALLNLYQILPLYLPGASNKRHTPTGYSGNAYRAVSINVLQDNQDYQRAASFIEESQPDILLLVEVNHAWLAALEPALDSLPFSIQEPRDDNYGIALFSRFPICEARVVGLISPEMPSICASIAIKGFTLTVLGTHPSPPKSKRQSQERNDQLKKLAALAASISSPLIVMGDLNLTNWSPYFRSLITNSALHDSRRGFGIQFTWPVKRPHLWIPIDHILLSSHLHVQNFTKGAYTGSDHYPIICDFSLNEANLER
jgi:endonuclease/exonuclease/phosphatase (EEP) superfamily protein YafD